MEDFEAMLYGGSPPKQEPKKQEPFKPTSKPVEAIKPTNEQSDAQDDIPLPSAPPEPTRYKQKRQYEQRREEPEEIMVMPHNGDAERSVLGSMLIDTVACDLGCNLLATDDFYVPANAEIFDAIKSLSTDGKAVDLITVTEILDGRNKLELAGGIIYLSDLITFVPTAANVKHYIDIVKKHSNRRKFIKSSDEAKRDAINGGEEYLKIAQNSVETIEQSRITEVERVGQKAVFAACAMGDTKTAEFSTGFKEIDKMLKGGFNRGETVVVAARPSQGKSSFAMNVTDHFLENGKVVYLQTMDDSETAFLQRLETKMSFVSWSEIDRYSHCSMGRSYVEAFMREAERLSAMPLYIDDSPSVTVEYIKAKAKSIKRLEGTLELIIVDYIGQIDTSSVQAGKRRAGSRAEEVAQVSSKLKILAKELDCVVMVIVQFNRAIDSRSDKRPNMSDLKESGGIEADANIIICPSLPYKDDPSRDPTETVFYILKSKGSQTGTVETIKWDGEHYLFYEGAHPRIERFRKNRMQLPTERPPEMQDVKDEDIPEEFKKE